MTAEAPGPNACLHSKGNFVGCGYFLRHQFYSLPAAYIQSCKKLGLKTKRLKIDMVKKCIQKIWANRVMAQLDTLFNENPG